MSRGGAIRRSHQPGLHVTGLGVGEGKREHGLLEREAGVADTRRHVGLGGHQGLGLEHGGQHLDTVNGHAELLLTTGHGLARGTSGSRHCGGRRRDKRRVGCGHDHRVVRLTREGWGVGGRWGH